MARAVQRLRPTINPSTRWDSVRSVGLGGTRGLVSRTPWGPPDALRSDRRSLKVATRVRIPLGVLHEGPGPVDQLGRPTPQLPSIRHPATLRGNAAIESPVEVMIAILFSPPHSVADPRITPSCTLGRTVPKRFARRYDDSYQDAGDRSSSRQSQRGRKVGQGPNSQGAMVSSFDGGESLRPSEATTTKWCSRSDMSGTRCVVIAPSVRPEKVPLS